MGQGFPVLVLVGGRVGYPVLVLAGGMAGWGSGGGGTLSWSWPGYPIPPCGQTERQTPVKTLPFRRTTYAGGNNLSVRTYPISKLLITSFLQLNRTRENTIHPLSTNKPSECYINF